MTLKTELHDSIRGRTDTEDQADDQEDQLQAALPQVHQSVDTEVCHTPVVLAF